MNNLINWKISEERLLFSGVDIFIEIVRDATNNMSVQPVVPSRFEIGTFDTKGEVQLRLSV